MKRKILFLVLVFIGTFVWNGMVSSVEALSLPSIQLGVDDIEEPEKVSSALQILFLLRHSGDSLDSGLPSGRPGPCQMHSPWYISRGNVLIFANDFSVDRSNGISTGSPTPN